MTIKSSNEKLPSRITDMIAEKRRARKLPSFINNNEIFIADDEKAEAIATTF